MIPNIWALTAMMFLIANGVVARPKGWGKVKPEKSAQFLPVTENNSPLILAVLQLKALQLVDPHGNNKPPSSQQLKNRSKSNDYYGEKIGIEEVHPFFMNDESEDLFRNEKVLDAPTDTRKYNMALRRGIDSSSPFHKDFMANLMKTAQVKGPEDIAVPATPVAPSPAVLPRYMTFK